MTISAQELRLGNIVDTVNHGNGKRSPNKTPYIVEAIGSSIVELCHIDCDRDKYHRFLVKAISDIEPIPLTEEWLLKFGFEKGKHAWFSKKYFTDCDEYAEVMKIDYNISSKRLAIYDAIEETDMVNILSHPIYTGKKVLYIHQLQNLFFALTGEELTIKETVHESL